MRIKLILATVSLVGASLAVAGCGFDILLNSRDGNAKVDPFTTQLVKIFYRVAGVGTVRTEIYNPDALGNWFLNFTTDLKSVTYGDTASIDISNQILPLAVGNQWQDSLAVLDSAGNFVTSVNLTSRVDRDTTLGGELWYILSSGGTPLFLGTNLSTGFWSRDIELISASDSIKTVGEPFASALYPTKKGATFETNPGFFIVVADTAASITVPAGTFEAVKYLKYVRLALE